MRHTTWPLTVGRCLQKLQLSIWPWYGIQDFTLLIQPLHFFKWSSIHLLAANKLNWNWCFFLIGWIDCVWCIFIFIYHTYSLYVFTYTVYIWIHVLYIHLLCMIFGRLVSADFWNSRCLSLKQTAQVGLPPWLCDCNIFSQGHGVFNSGFLDWESFWIDDNLLKVLVQAPYIHVIWVYDYIYSILSMPMHIKIEAHFLGEGTVKILYQKQFAREQRSLYTPKGQ